MSCPHRLAVLGACLLALAGCHPGRGEPPDLSAYGGVVSNAVFAWAWGGASGYQEKNGFPVRVIFQPEPETSGYRLVACDPHHSPCDSLTLFEDLAIKPREFAGGLLAEFRTDLEEEDRSLVVTAERGNQLLTSETIVATVASRPTSYAAGGLRFDAAALEFSWPRVPDEPQYVLALVDEGSDNAATGIVTKRKVWAYPELQGIVQHLHDPAMVHDLQPAHEYAAVLFAINRQHWTTLITDLAVKP